MGVTVKKYHRLMYGNNCWNKLYCLVTEAHWCKQLAQGHYTMVPSQDSNPRPTLGPVNQSNNQSINQLKQIYIALSVSCESEATWAASPAVLSTIAVLLSQFSLPFTRCKMLTLSRLYRVCSVHCAVCAQALPVSLAPTLPHLQLRLYDRIEMCIGLFLHPGSKDHHYHHHRHHNHHLFVHKTHTH